MTQHRLDRHRREVVALVGGSRSDGRQLGDDERGRLVGENVWEYDDGEHELIELDPEDVLAAARAVELLDPLIAPLPASDDRLLVA